MFAGSSELSGQLAGELVKQELAACLLEVLLGHGGTAFEASVHERRRSSHNLARVDNRVVQLVVHLLSEFRVQGLHGGLAVSD